jgi:vacuolar-type H+-ATPase subunit F/Vma7
MHPGRIWVIGEQDAVMGCGLIGLEGQVVTTLPEADRALDEALYDPTVALILLTEQWAEQLQERVAEAMLSAVGPTVVEIPSARFKRASALHERIERRLGLIMGG